MLTNLELLRTFLAAADTNTFQAAAAERHVTKSAVSQQIKLLEEQLAIPLFERSGRRAHLTQNGFALADAARRGLDVIDQAVDAIMTRHDEVSGDVRIGAPGPFTRLWLRPRMASLLKAHPSLQLTVSFGTPAELERRLANRDLDLILLVRPVELLGIEAVPVFTETFRAYASASYLKACGTPSSLADLQHHRFIVYDDDLPMHGPWWRANFGIRAPFRGSIVCRVANLFEMRALAEEGVGIVVLPDYFARESVRSRAIVEIVRATKGRAKPAKNDIMLAWRKGAVLSACFRTTRDALAS